MVVFPMLRVLAVTARLLRVRRPSSCSFYAQTKRLYNIPSSSTDEKARFALCRTPIQLLSSLASAVKENWTLDEMDMMDKSHEFQLTVGELKDLCRERGLFVSGRRAELIERLKDYILFEKKVLGEYRRMSGEDVKVACSVWGLNNRGTFEELCDRLETWDCLRECHDHSNATAPDSKLDSDKGTNVETQDKETDSRRALDEMETETIEKSHGDPPTVAQLKQLCKEWALLLSEI